MITKLKGSWQDIVVGLMAMCATPIAFAALQAPVAATPTSTAPLQVADAGSTDQFQQWLQNGNNEPPPALTSPSSTTTTTTSTATTVSPMPSAPLIKNPSQLTYDEEKQVMLDSAPDSSLPPNPDANTAFNAMLQQNMPLSPKQVVKLRQQIDTSQRAAVITPTIPPKPVSTTLMINQAPGTTPPAVRLAQGYVSSLVFVDSTGAPWPIAAFDIGNPKTVNLQWDGKSNIILIQAVSPYSSGNMVVRLVGLPTPVTLEIVAGQRVVDYRVDIHVSGIGPNTKDVPMGEALPNSANQLLLGVLDGVAPPGSKPLTVRGGTAEAWLVGQTMYLRTRLTILSPGWVGKMSSPDGMQAYELPRTSSVLVSRYGTPAELKIEGL